MSVGANIGLLASPCDSNKSHRSFPLAQLKLSRRNVMLRAIWNLVWLLLYRPTPMPLYPWRRLLLRAFGARVEAGAHPCPKARIWAPWNLTMGAHSCLADYVDCYCVAPVALGAHATVSQYSYLCTASHDYQDPSMPLVVAPITILAEAWVAADVFVAPGVLIGEGAVVGARSTVTTDVQAWMVAAGSPVKIIGTRERFSRAPAEALAQ
jgi:putative colanic acid biosynthesis acetyltransferase WcaF